MVLTKLGNMRMGPRFEFINMEINVLVHINRETMRMSIKRIQVEIN